ncbi:hypothetical protein PybrP1_002860 [[Pythium] brassicae (nom. inval.)]|nr:hypothetical protein PybrP1_002860 [[Pythium] brassicae (nom. inval.)]
MSNITFVGARIGCYNPVGGVARILTTASTANTWLPRWWRLSIVCGMVVVEGIPIYAHKIFCVRCNYFKAMLAGEVRSSVRLWYLRVAAHAGESFARGENRGRSPTDLSVVPRVPLQRLPRRVGGRDDGAVRRCRSGK